MDKENTKRVVGTRRLRACLSCSLLKSGSSFRSSGCDNCPFQSIKKRLSDYTSENYRGIIAVNDSNRSWVAKWQKVRGFVKGNYAIIVYGTLSDGAIERLEDEGRQYFRRDKPFSIN